MSVEIKGHRYPSFFLAFTQVNLSTLLIMKTTDSKAIRSIDFTVSHKEHRKTETNVFILCLNYYRNISKSLLGRGRKGGNKCLQEE